MRCFILTVVMLAAVGVAGCGEEVKTVEWYKAEANRAALDATIKACLDNPGKLKDTPNCQNARAAKEALFLGGAFEKVKEPEVPFFSGGSK